tara:strand:- start:551 stop:2503 length:1953 start_codon:yes stop_codon:yes gene_type:complete
VADYGVNIQFRTVGLSQLDKAKARVQELEKSVSKIRSLDLGKAIGGKTGDRLAEATGQIRRYATQLNKTGKVIGNTRVQQQAALESFENLRDSVKIGSPIFNTLNKAIAQQTKLMNVNTISTNKNSRAKRNNNKAARGGSGQGGGRMGQALSSGLISGAFPLLFGQGPLGGAFGFAGGFGGSLVGGQMGGFAGGLVATAALQQIQTFITNISQLGQAMSAITPNIAALSKAMGIVGTQEERRLQAIEKLSGKQAAFNAAMEKMKQTIGEEATARLKAFGETSRLIGNEFAIAMTKMQASLIPVVNLIDKFFGISKQAEKSERVRAIENATNPEIVRRREEIERLQNTTGGGRSGAKRRSDRIKVLKSELEVLGKQEVKINKRNKKNEADKAVLEASLKATIDKTRLLQDTLQFGEQEALIRQKILQIEQQEGITLDENGRERIRNAMELERSLQRQVEFTKAIGDSFKESFKNAITGASTFREAMVNVLNTIKNKLIDSQIDRLFDSARSRGGSRGGGIGGLLGGLFGGRKSSGGGSNFGSFNLGINKPSNFLVSGLGGLFANGGRPPVGKASLVGERGAELFVPRSSGTIIPNNQLGGSTTNIVNVSVDASGSSVSGNSQDAQALGAVIGAAVQAQLVKEKRPGGLLTR